MQAGLGRGKSSQRETGDGAAGEESNREAGPRKQWQGRRGASALGGLASDCMARTSRRGPARYDLAGTAVSRLGGARQARQG